MALDITRALADGLDRTLAPTGLQLFTLYVALTLAETAVFGAVQVTVRRGQVDAALLDQLLGTDVSPVVAAFVELPAAVLGAGAVLVFLAGLVVRMGAIRTLVSEDREVLALARFTRRPVALAHFVLATIVVIVATVAGLALLILPGIYLALGLYVYAQEIMVADRGAIDALAGSWALTAGHRVELLGLGLVLALVEGGFSTVGGLTTGLFPVVGLLLSSLLGGAATVFAMAVTARAYDQLRQERAVARGEVADGDEDFDLGP
jgi:hypothetical protein